MRRSFGGGGGRNMGGGGGGGGMIRTVQRAMRAGVGGPPPEPLSCSGAAPTATTISRTANDKHPTSLSISSSSSGVNNNGTSAAFCSLINFPLSSSCSSSVDESDEWECVDGIEEGGAVVFCEDFDHVFGTVPSADEVHHAVSALQQAFAPSGNKKVAADEVGSPERLISPEMDWIEPSPRFYNTKILPLHGPDRSVYDAFHLLETEPCVQFCTKCCSCLTGKLYEIVDPNQRMVISLSSDKAVWDAVLNNEVVKELRGSISEEGLMEECNSDEGCDDSNPMKDILSWIIANGKAKIMQVMDSIRKLMHEAFQALNGENDRDRADPFQEKLKTSLLLSIMVLIVVVITRTKSV